MGTFKGSLWEVYKKFSSPAILTSLFIKFDSLFYWLWRVKGKVSGNFLHLGTKICRPSRGVYLWFTWKLETLIGTVWGGQGQVLLTADLDSFIESKQMCQKPVLQGVSLNSHQACLWRKGML